MGPASRMEKLFANLFLVSLAFYLTLIITELLLRFFLFHPTYAFQTADLFNGNGSHVTVELIPDNLFTLQPNKEMGINKYGFRDYDFSTQRNGKKRIVFVGDSFTMGVNVKTEESMPKLLEKQLKDYEVYNLGIVGMGPDQQLNNLEKYGFKFKPDMVIEGICALNSSGDIYGDQLYKLGPNGEAVYNKNNCVKSMVFPSFFALSNQIHFLMHRNEILNVLDPVLFGHSYDLTWTKFAESNEAKYKFSLMKGILKKINDEVTRRNIKFLAIIIPSYQNMCNDQFFKDNNVDPSTYFRNEEVYQFILNSLNIPNINLVPYFMRLDKDQRCSLYDPGNGHFSPLGNLYAAQIIKLYMDNNGLTEK